MVRIGVNGLGRIGRSIVRAAVELGMKDIVITAANGPAPIEEHAYLLKYDSVQGTCPATIRVQNDHISVGEQKIKILHERDPNKLPWRELGVDIVLECTGKFSSRKDAALHLGQAKKVIVSAPSEGADATIVMGVNEHILNASHDVISIGSCTTNALAPIAKILNDNIGIECGFMTTIHSYTGDQNLLDASHKDKRRSRAAALSMVPTSTGAAKAIGVVLPELDGKLGGAAVRVPTPNVSMIDLCFTAKQDVTSDSINQLIAEACKRPELQNIIAQAEDKLVSIDFNHTTYSSIFDPYETKVVGKRFCRVVSWYDNEWAFSVRMLEAARKLAAFIE
jgi:glyceraldehyde 3-phosphate dehydrogenase